MMMTEQAVLAAASSGLLMLTWIGGAIVAAIRWQSCPRSAAVTLACALTLLVWQILSFLISSRLPDWLLEPSSVLLGFQALHLLGSLLHALVYLALGYAIFAGRGERSVG